VGIFIVKGLLVLPLASIKVTVTSILLALPNTKHTPAMTDPMNPSTEKVLVGVPSKLKLPEPPGIN
jgi:hypothetical protein